MSITPFEVFKSIRTAQSQINLLVDDARQQINTIIVDSQKQINNVIINAQKKIADVHEQLNNQNVDGRSFEVDTTPLTDAWVCVETPRDGEVVEKKGNPEDMVKSRIIDLPNSDNGEKKNVVQANNTMNSHTGTSSTVSNAGNHQVKEPVTNNSPAQPKPKENPVVNNTVQASITSPAQPKPSGISSNYTVGNSFSSPQQPKENPVVNKVPVTITSPPQPKEEPTKPAPTEKEEKPAVDEQALKDEEYARQLQRELDEEDQRLRLAQENRDAEFAIQENTLEKLKVDEETAILKKYEEFSQLKKLYEQAGIPLPGLPGMGGQEGGDDDDDSQPQTPFPFPGLPVGPGGQPDFNALAKALAGNLNQRPGGGFGGGQFNPHVSLNQQNNVYPGSRQFDPVSSSNQEQDNSDGDDLYGSDNDNDNNNNDFSRFSGKSGLDAVYNQWNQRGQNTLPNSNVIVEDVTDHNPYLNQNNNDDDDDEQPSYGQHRQEEKNEEDAKEQSLLQYQREQTRRLKDEQDYKYETSVMVDKSKEEWRKAEEKKREEEKKKQEEERIAKEEAQRQEAIKRAQDEAEKSEEVRKRFEDLRTIVLPPEGNSETGITIRVYLPEGKLVDRKFAPEDKMQNVKDFIALQALPEHGAKTIPRDFTIFTQFPRTIYDDLEKTLQDYKLSKSIIVRIAEK